MVEKKKSGRQKEKNTQRRAIEKKKLAGYWLLSRCGKEKGAKKGT